MEAISGIPEATLEIIGAGPEADALVSLSKRLGLADRVTFRGFVDQRDLPDVYRAFDVVVAPSRPSPGWREQFCRVAVEAMASGVPVVVSDTGALPEVVGEGGVLVTPGDADALRAVLRRMLDDPDLWERTRRAAVDRAPGFAWSAVAEAHNALYDEVMPCTTP
jgi:glycosyltransferase involved in cell wall biosynthesis